MNINIGVSSGATGIGSLLKLLFITLFVPILAAVVAAVAFPDISSPASDRPAEMVSMRPTTNSP